MSALTQSSSINSSVSSQHCGIDDIETTKVKNYVKDLVKSRIFLGRYLERRLVDQRVGYRDVVVLSPAEVDLRKDLAEVQYKLRILCPIVHWIGITDGKAFGDLSNVYLWTEIDNQPFGVFWFQIRNLKFREQETVVTLKCIRHISDAFLEIEPILTGTATARKSLKCTTSNNSNSEANDITTTSLEPWNDFITTLKSSLSITNVKDFITFLCALIIAIFTGSTAFINFLGNFILALIRELSIFVKNSTPIFLGFLDFLSKIVGGFYIVVSMIFRPSRTAGPPSRSAMTYYDRPHSSNYAYDDRHFD